MPLKKKAKSKKTFFSAHEKRKPDPQAHEQKENGKSVCLPSPGSNNKLFPTFIHHVKRQGLTQFI